MQGRHWSRGKFLNSPGRFFHSLMTNCLFPTATHKKFFISPRVEICNSSPASASASCNMSLIFPSNDMLATCLDHVGNFASAMINKKNMYILGVDDVFFWPNNNAFDVPKTYLLYQFLSLLAGAAFLISVVCPARLEIGGYPISRRKWMNITHLWRIDFQKNMVKFHGYGDIWLSKITRGFSRRKVRVFWLKSSFTFL